MTKRYLKKPAEIIAALKEGKTVKSSDGAEYELENGFVIENSSEGIVAINPTLYGSTEYYTEEPDEVKLQVGKFYKTRRGDKVICLSLSKNDFYIHKLDSYIVGYWVDKTGRMLFNGVPERTETDSDVVALWED